MNRTIKALGLVAFVALAMSAMFALTASAEEGQKKGFYAAGETPETFEDATLIGKQYDEPGEPWNFFKAGGQNVVTCHNATFTSTIDEGTQKELTVTPDYEKCYTGDNTPVTVTMNGCDFVFKQPTTAKDAGTGNYTAKVGLTCPHENKIQIHVYLFGSSTTGNHSFNVCTIEVYPNEPVTQSGTETAHRFEEYGGNSHVILDTTKEKVAEKEVDDVTIAATVEGISYTNHCEDHDGEDGTYRNTVTATAWDDEDDSPDPTVHDEVLEAWIEEEA